MGRIDNPDRAEVPALTISVVIPNRNDGEFLVHCLEALRRQERPADEVIVVDNESTDDSCEVALRFGAKCLTQPHTGIWPAASLGFDAARGDILARLDTDSLPPADWLARIESAFAADPGLSAITGSAKFYGGNALKRWMGEHWYIGGMYFAVTPWLGHPPVFGSNFAMRRGLWLDVRDRVARDNPRVHDDLDLSIQFRPWHRVRFDPDLGMRISARPFASPRALGRRVWRTVETVRVSWPAGAPFRRRRERRRYAADAAHAAGRSAAPRESGP